MSARELLEQHRQLLEASAISAEVAAERGYWSATRKSELEVLGFKRPQQNVGLLTFPWVMSVARGGAGRGLRG